MSEVPQHLKDPDEWYLPEMPKNDVLWVQEDCLRELYEDMIYNWAEELDKKLSVK